MICLNNLLTGYKGQSIGKPLSGNFKHGSMTAIIGANGTGKSTLLKTIAGLITPVAGKIIFGKEGRPCIGYLPQQIEIDRNFPLTVFDVVAIGCWPATSLLGCINYSQQESILQALEQVGMNNSIQSRTISSLSGGQFQRMLFARLLVQKASLILLDEPFLGIDSKTCCILIELIDKLHKLGCTIITVLHDTNLVVKHFTDILMLTPMHNIWDSSFNVLKKYLEPGA